MSCTLCINYYTNKREKHHADVAASLDGKNQLAERAWRSLKSRAAVPQQIVPCAQKVFDEWLTINLSKYEDEDKYDILSKSIVAIGNAIHKYDIDHKSPSGSTKNKLDVILTGMTKKLKVEKQHGRSIFASPVKKKKKRCVTFKTRGELSAALRSEGEDQLHALFAQRTQLG